MLFFCLDMTEMSIYDALGPTQPPTLCKKNNRDNQNLSYSFYTALLSALVLTKMLRGHNYTCHIIISAVTA